MSQFNKKVFCNNLTFYRKKKGISQIELGVLLNKDRSNISRYESGQTLPDIEILLELCNILGVSLNTILGIDDIGIEFDDSKNLFGTDSLYIYYKIARKPYKGIFKINFIDIGNHNCKVNFVDYKTDMIYMFGSVRMNKDCAIFSFDNYESNSPPMDRTEIILNVKYAKDKLYMGCIFGTKDGYSPTIRKCIISKEYIPFTDEMLERLNINEEEFEQIKRDGYWNPNIINKNNYDE